MGAEGPPTTECHLQPYQIIWLIGLADDSRKHHLNVALKADEDTHAGQAEFDMAQRTVAAIDEVLTDLRRMRDQGMAINGERAEARRFSANAPAHPTPEVPR